MFTASVTHGSCVMSVFCDVSDWIFHSVLSFNYQMMKIKLFKKCIIIFIKPVFFFTYFLYRCR